MDNEKKARLEAKGWKVGSTEEFLELAGSNDELRPAYELRTLLQTGVQGKYAERLRQQMVQVEARREETEALATMEGMDLGVPEVMDKAWRS